MCLHHWDTQAPLLQHCNMVERRKRIDRMYKSYISSFTSAGWISDGGDSFLFLLLLLHLSQWSAGSNPPHTNPCSATPSGFLYVPFLTVNCYCLEPSPFQPSWVYSLSCWGNILASSLGADCLDFYRRKGDGTPPPPLKIRFCDGGSGVYPSQIRLKTFRSNMHNAC